jgi:hypothetical protein
MTRRPREACKRRVRKKAYAVRRGVEGRIRRQIRRRASLDPSFTVSSPTGHESPPGVLRLPQQFAVMFDADAPTSPGSAVAREPGPYRRDRGGGASRCDAARARGGRGAERSAAS